MLPAEQHYPALDLIRFAVLWPGFNSAVTTPAGMLVRSRSFFLLFSLLTLLSSADNVISRLMQRHLSTSAQNPPKSVVLIGLRLLSNLFAHSAGAQYVLLKRTQINAQWHRSYLVSPAVVPQLVDTIVMGLNSADASSRLSGATLAYNTSLYLVCNESEALAQLLSVITALLNESTLKADDETAFLLLLSLGHFMCVPFASFLVSFIHLQVLQQYSAGSGEGARHQLGALPILQQCARPGHRTRSAADADVIIIKKSSKVICTCGVVTLAVRECAGLASP